MYNEDVGICIIDSGINEAALRIGKLSTNLEITRKLQLRQRPRYDGGVISHATVCAAIIRKYAADAVLHSMKILNSREKSTIEQLKAAVLWCLDNNIGIIHMSIGSIIYSDFAEISRLANMAWKHGAIIVAACNNNGKVTYPAALDSVIGVKCDRSSILKEGEYIYNGVGFDGVEITAYSRHSLTLPSGKNFDTVCTNSYAAPFITALVHNIMRENPGISLHGIKAALRKGAKEERDELYTRDFSRHIDWVENALTVDFGNNKLLSSIRTPFNMEKSIKANLEDSGKALNSIENSLGKADTIILLPPDCKNRSYEDGITNLLENIGGLNRNVIYLGKGDIGTIACSRRKNQDIRVWHPDIYRSFDYKQYLKKEIEVPAIMLYASSQHLLIELLQKLVNCFSEDSYHATGISDSPLGILAGLEYLCVETNTHTHKDNVQALYNLHDPDVMVVGFKEKSSFAAAANKIKPDIRLIVLDNTMTANEELLSISEGEDSRLVYIVPEGLSTALQHEGSTVALNYMEGDSVGKIYKCILSILGA